MIRITAYMTVLSRPGDPSQTLDAQVNNAIRRGWQPVGPMMLCPNNSVYQGCELQTMVKYAEEKKEEGA